MEPEDLIYQQEVLTEMWESKADFCLNLRIAPSEYDQMSIPERNAFVTVHNRLHKR